MIIDEDLNESMQSFDVVHKIDAINEWHLNRNIPLPKHIQMYFNYINSFDSYQKLREFKDNGEKDSSIIQPIYETFVNEYFGGNGLKDEINKAFLRAF